MATQTYVFLQDKAAISLVRALGYELETTSASPYPFLIVWDIEYSLGGKLVVLCPSKVKHLPEGYRTRSESVAISPSAIAAILNLDDKRAEALPAGQQRVLRKVKRRMG